MNPSKAYAPFSAVNREPLSQVIKAPVATAMLPANPTALPASLGNTDI